MESIVKTVNRKIWKNKCNKYKGLYPFKMS